MPQLVVSKALGSPKWHVTDCVISFIRALGGIGLLHLLEGVENGGIIGNMLFSSCKETKRQISFVVIQGVFDEVLILQHDGGLKDFGNDGLRKTYLGRTIVFRRFGVTHDPDFLAKVFQTFDHEFVTRCFQH